jgi:4-hydroxyphenylpyruvate dioxygenase-like putative hemolysin
MSRLDHIAYRVYNKDKARQFFEEKFYYKLADEFDIEFNDGTTVKCFAMSPPEKIECDWEVYSTVEMEIPRKSRTWMTDEEIEEAELPDYHMAPEIFISEGEPGSIVDQWLMKNGAGIHHLAYEVRRVTWAMDQWSDIEFMTDKPLECPGLIQVFTKVHPVTGMIYELIQRTDKGFCKENVKGLMESSDG